MKFNITIDDYKIDPNLDTNNSSFVYGEVDPESICNLFDNCQMDIENKSFLDIGSGCGNVIIYLARFAGMYCTGIEIDHKRFSKSIQKLESNWELQNTIEFTNSSFVTTHFAQYDIIYCCNTVFSPDDNKLLYKKILTEFTGFLILFQFDHTLKPFLIKSYIVRTSWCNKVDVYLFEINSK